MTTTMTTMTTSKDLIQYITAAVDHGYEALAPELREMCDRQTARVERLARVAAGINDSHGVFAAKILAGTDVVKDAVTTCCLIAEFVPTRTDYIALCEYVASEAINDARRKAEREKTKAQ